MEISLNCHKKRHILFSNLSYHFLVVWFIFGAIQLSIGQVINYETKVSIDYEKKTTTRIVLIQINNKAENWLSHIEIRHDPKQQFKFNYAQIIDVEGNTIRKLKKKELITRNDLSYQAFFQDDLITEFDLYWNQYPYRVEYSYTIEEEEYLYLAWWTPFYKSNISTIESALEINLPTTHTTRITSSKNLAFEEFELAGRKILRWKSSMVKNIYRDELYSPPIEKLIPFVKVVPYEFKYGVPGKSDSWTTFGNWLDQLNKGTDQITQQEKLNVEKLIADCSSKHDTIKSIYYYLQDHTKYVNVAIDVGGLKSYPASYVCENKYGDCKALTTYMKAMLKSVDIESYYTIIKAGENESEIDISTPSQQFNHVVLMIPTETDTLWLENTSSSVPFNYLGTFTQNKFALVIN